MHCHQRVWPHCCISLYSITDILPPSFDSAARVWRPGAQSTSTMVPASGMRSRTVLEHVLEIVLEVVHEFRGGKLSLKIFLMLSLMFFLMLSLMLYFMLSLMIVTSLVWLTLLTYMKSQPYMMPRTGLKVSVVVVVRLWFYMDIFSSTLVASNTFTLL